MAYYRDTQTLVTAHEDKVMKMWNMQRFSALRAMQVMNQLYQ